VPYSNQTVVDDPLGLTAPLTVAVLAPAVVTASVDAVAAALGTKLTMSPRLVPFGLLAAIR